MTARSEARLRGPGGQIEAGGRALLGVGLLGARLAAAAWAWRRVPPPGTKSEDQTRMSPRRPAGWLRGGCYETILQAEKPRLGLASCRWHRVGISRGGRGRRPQTPLAGAGPQPGLLRAQGPTWGPRHRAGSLAPRLTRYRLPPASSEFRLTRALFQALFRTFSPQRAGGGPWRVLPAQPRLLRAHRVGHPHILSAGTPLLALSPW